MGEAGAAKLCARAPLSDHATKERPPSIASASSEWVEPTIAVRVNGPGAVSPSRLTSSPAGEEVTVSWVVLGSSRRVAVPTSPFSSTAVSRSRMLDG